MGYRMRITELFYYTYDEYLKFNSFFSSKEVLVSRKDAGYEDYVPIQTKLMLLRKYGTKDSNVNIEKVLNDAIEIAPDREEEISDLINEYKDFQNNDTETVLADGTVKSLYEFMEDVIYGLYLHADELRIKELEKIDSILLLSATRKYVDGFEAILTKTYELVGKIMGDLHTKPSYERKPVIALNVDRSRERGITNSPRWSNLYGGDLSDEDAAAIMDSKPTQDILLMGFAYLFFMELQRDNYSISRLSEMVFPPTREEWGDFSEYHKMAIQEKDVGCSNEVEYHERGDMAYVKLVNNVEGGFYVEGPHLVSEGICIVSLVFEKRYGWRVYCIGKRADYYKETLSIKESIKRLFHNKS